MIKGIGIDMIEVSRVTDSIRKPGFREKIFTKAELEMLQERNNPQVYAGQFTAKEAVSKALGTGIGKIKWTDIEVLRRNDGSPYVVLYNKAAEILGNGRVYISITNLNEIAAAFALIEEG